MQELNITVEEEGGGGDFSNPRGAIVHRKHLTRFEGHVAGGYHCSVWSTSLGWRIPDTSIIHR